MPDKIHHLFPDTHWSLVRQAGSAVGEARRHALEVLLKRYEPALLSYLWSKRRLGGEEAGELLQAFILDKVLEYELLKHADQKKGRFRTFLLTSLDRFAIDHYRKATRRRTPDGGDAWLFETPAADATAAAIAEAAWARSLIHAVLENMKAECQQTKRMDIWIVFEKRILAELFEGQKPIAYEQLAIELKMNSPMQVANLLVTGKRMYARLMRAAVSEYELEESNIELEIADLRRALETADPLQVLPE